jgi:peptide/nickel transport system permease protein
VLRYIARRILSTIPVLLGLSLVLFVFIHLLPGDPPRAMLGEHATPETIARLRETLGLDQPLWRQYLDYLSRLLHGDLGASIINSAPVVADFAVRFPSTIELTAAALLFAAGAGIPLGQFAARHNQGSADAGVTLASLLGVSIPVFVLGLALQYVFGAELRILPTGGEIDPRLGLERQTGFVVLDAVLSQRPVLIVDALKHLILPAISLGSIPLAIITRITRASVIEVANEDYVRTARAKGLTEGRVNRRHIMRNAWLPVVTVVGLEVGSLLGGAVITETIFAWNGVGRWVVQAIQNRDYFVVQSSIMIFAFIFVIVNLLVDVGYVYVNPRIRYS